MYVPNYLAEQYFIYKISNCLKSRYNVGNIYGEEDQLVEERQCQTTSLRACWYCWTWIPNGRPISNRK